MPLVVGVTFRRVGKVYYFDPGELELHEGDFVIAETARGMEFGEVAMEPREVTEEELVAPLKKIARVATGDDLDREATNREREKHAYEVCDRKIAEHNLPMKLLDAECAFDGSQITFSFSADGRIDFRDLVKDVASALHAKVQLHQIGVRDEAKLIGGYGGCGRSLCCATFLSNFEPISMKMAKDQSLFLNPAKFSGVCGKLMCCLRYEHEHYKYSQKRLPAVGAILEVEHGRAKVVDVNVINNMVTLETEEGVQIHVPACKLSLEGLCRKHGIACNMQDKNCVPLLPGDAPIPDEPDDEEPIEDDLAFDLDTGIDGLSVVAEARTTPRPTQDQASRSEARDRGREPRPSAGPPKRAEQASRRSESSPNGSGGNGANDRNGRGRGRQGRSKSRRGNGVQKWRDADKPGGDGNSEGS